MPPTAVDIADRAFTTFLVAAVAAAVAGVDYGRAAVLAALAAVLAAAVTTAALAVTGDPALGALVSATLRVRREVPKRRPLHRVPLTTKRRKAAARVSHLAS